MNKKLLSLALAGALGLSLTACGGTASQPSTNPSTQPSEAQESAAQTEEAAGETETEAAEGYADNFAVDSEAAEAFAAKIQEAVAAQDLEGLQVMRVLGRNMARMLKAGLLASEGRPEPEPRIVTSYIR